MVRLKGFEPIYVLMGLMLVFFLLLIVFKLFGQFGAFEYEQQAEISTRNMQTAMNQVCISGETQKVSINLPQTLSSGGLAKNPVSLAKSALWDRDVGAVADSLRYMSALDSYGDPWYIIYYENFPQGEDSGWQGWSTLATMRSTSSYATGANTVACMVPLIGMAKSVGMRHLKGLVTIDDVAGEYSRANEIKNLLASTYISLSQTNQILRAKAFRDIGQKIIANAKGRYSESSIGKVLSRFEIVATDASKGSEAVKHLGAFNKIERELLPEADKNLAKLSAGLGSRSPELRDKTKSLLDKFGGLKSNTQLTEAEYKAELGGIAGSTHVKSIYQSAGNLMENDVAGIKLILKDKGFSTPERENILDDIVAKLKNGNDLNDREVYLAKWILKDPSTGQTINGAENFVDMIESTRALQKDIGEMGTLSGKLYGETYPIEYSRVYSTAADSGSSTLPSLSKYVSFLGTGRTAVQAGSSAATREGRWVATAYGGSFVFNQVAVSPFEQSQYKFNPCSGNALCMKSVVNPSISVYPLEDCKAVGVDYIELDKTPADASLLEGDAGVAATSGLNTMGSFVTGEKVNSRFYSAAPCSGKIQIEKTTCNCKPEPVAYMDPSSIDSYLMHCKVLGPEGSGVGLECELSKNKTYMGETGEVEKLGNFKVTAKTESTSIVTGTEDTNPATFNSISFDLSKTDDYPAQFVDKDGKNLNVNVWTYFEDYRKIFEEKPSEDELSKIIAGLSEESANLACEVALPDLAGQEFDCPPIALPSIPFYYHVCNYTSNIWLECKNWEKIGEGSLSKDGINGKDKVPANEWCCLSWAISNEAKTPVSSNEAGATKEVEILSVPSCNAYQFKEIKANPESEESKKYSSLRVDGKVINNNLKCAFGIASCLKIAAAANNPTWKVGEEDRTFEVKQIDSNKAEVKITSGLSWSAGPEDICKIVSGENEQSVTIKAIKDGGCMIKIEYKEGIMSTGETKFAVYTQKIQSAVEITTTSETTAELNVKTSGTPSDLGISDPAAAANYISLISGNVSASIMNSRSVLIPKYSEQTQVKIDSGELNPKTDKDKIKEIDPNDNGIETSVGQLLWYNLPQVTPKDSQASCLKVSYITEDEKTKGFCYTSPTSWADAKSVGWIVAATAADVGAQAAITYFTGGVGAGASSVASCLLSNYVMYYGEQAVSKEKQASYWPNNVYFANYFR